MSNRSVWLFSAVVLALIEYFPARPAHAQEYNANMPQAGEDTGLAAGRTTDASFGAESIDPFTGALKIVATDLVIPSNGGLDLAVVRTYQSFAKTNISVPDRSHQKGRTNTGIGWDLHFGRLWRGNGSAAPQLVSTNTVNGCRVSNVTSRDNPVLELPDGSRQLFAASNSAETDFAYISPGRWILRCLPTAQGSAGAIAISPEGVRYTFSFLHRVSGLPISNLIYQQNSNYAFHVTKIEHPNGTSIDVSYVPTGSSYYAALSAVTHSEGHSVTFSYENVNSAAGARLRSFQQARPASEGGARTWTLNYVSAAAGSGYEYLESVVRPDSRRTSYEYVALPPSGPLPTGVFSLRRVTTPLGGVVTYTYQERVFTVRDYPNPLPVAVVSRKEVARTGVAVDGTWTYNYRPAPSASPTRDFTDVSGPGSCTIYEHEASPTSGGSSWRIGLLLSRTVAPPQPSSYPPTTCAFPPILTEVNTWEGLAVADQDYFRPPAIADPATYAPRLGARAATLNGNAYTTTLANPDAYGNPTSISEAGWATNSAGNPVSTSRTTDFTYFTDETAWIINRKRNETVVAAGPTYATPTSSPVTTNHIISRDFYTDARIGLMRFETRAGVTTEYDYYTGATAGGAVSKVTDANGVATTTVDDYATVYASYRRGQPRTVTRSIDGTTTNQQIISREIGEAGTVLWEQDGEGKRTTYTYDPVNLLTAVATARPSIEDDDIAISRPSTSTTETVTRGNYREVRQYNGFGELVRTDWSDSGNVVLPLFRRTDYDPEGRVERSYYPNSTSVASSERVEYDALNRITRITHPGGSFVRYEYLPYNQVRVTDERGFVSTLGYRSFGDPGQRELVWVRAERGDSPGSGLTQITFIDRNRLGQPLSITENGVTRTYKYNSKFFLFEENHPEVAVGAAVPNTVRFTHDLVGNVLTRTVGGTASTQVTYVLDRLYRTDGIAFTDATANVDFDYYKNNELRMVSKAGTRWDYLYDLNNNLTQERLTLSAPTYSPRVYQFDHEHDRRDVRRYLTYPSGLRLDYAPDVFGRATRIDATQGGSATTGFATNIAYHPNGQLHSITSPNGLTTTYEQDTRLRPSAFITAGTLNGAYQRVVDRLYGYDSANNVELVTDYLVAGSSKSMTYDGLNRLRTANGGWGTGSVTYTPTNNIQTKSFASQSLTLNYDASNRLSGVTGTTPLSFAYDVYGNITATGRATFGNFNYDDDSLLKTVSDASSVARISYNYDGNRRQTLERYLDGWATRYKAHTLSGAVHYEEDVVNFIAKDSVYLNGRVVGTRTRCTSSQDTDSDGINDCTEFRIGLVKTNAADAGLDSDGDGLTNLAEVQAGTDVFKNDTDADGLNDGYEVTIGLSALIADSNSDTDGDGLSNLVEFGMRTNPTKVDTDNDGIPDNLDPSPLFNPAILPPILELLLN